MNQAMVIQDFDERVGDLLGDNSCFLKFLI